MSDQPATFTYTRDDNRILGTVELNKSGFPEEGIPGGQLVGFTLFSVGADRKMYQERGNDSPFGSEQTLAGNGKITWNNVPWGKYYVRETKTPAGYSHIPDIENIVIGSAEQYTSSVL